MDGGAWWATVHGVAKSRTRLSDFTFTFHFSCIGEGNGNPLQCSCLENPRDGGAWWAAVYGVTQSWTRLKRPSSSSSSSITLWVWHHCKRCICTDTLKPQNDAMKKALLLFPCYSRENWGREKLDGNPKVTYLISKTSSIKIHAV